MLWAIDKDVVDEIHNDVMHYDMSDPNEYPYNIEFGDGRTTEEMDKMQLELFDDEELQ